MSKALAENRKIKYGFWLLMIYIGCVALRFWFTTLTTAYPTVAIDEFLYSSLGKSIATEGKLLYRGQPALYNYIVYPLFLAPVYLLLPYGTNYYRAIQLWNSILMNLSVFPIYFLGKDLFKNRKKALWIAACCLLLPDFSLSEFIFSEAVIYPLFFWAALLIYRSVKEEKVVRFALIGFLGAVLYYTKPGAIVAPAVFLLWFFIRGLIRKNRYTVRNALIGIGAFAISFGVMWAIAHFLLGYKGTFLSVYQQQLETEGRMFWDIFLRASVSYPYYFCLACGVIPGIVFLSGLRRMNQDHRCFWGMMTASALIVMVGTAWAINRAEHLTALLLRYVAMYIPIIFIGCLVSCSESQTAEVEKPGRHLPIGGCILCLYLMAWTAIWGSTMGIAGYFENHFLVSLAALFQPNIKGISDILIYLLCIAGLYLIAGRSNSKLKTAVCVSCFMVSMIANNVCGYVETGSNAYQKYGEEAFKTQTELIKGDDYVYLFSNEKTTCDFGLNIYSRHNDQQLEWYDFFNNIHEHNGAYAPFVPVSERGMSEGGMTKDVNVLVAEKTTYPLIQFSENIQGNLTEYENFYVGRFESGSRIVDAMMANMESFKLLQRNYGVLTLYRDDWINHPVRITLNIESPVNQHMRFYANDEHSMTIDLESGQYAYIFQIPKAAKGYNFVVDQADIMVYGFSVESWTE